MKRMVHVLVADDDRPTRELLHELLEEAGYEVLDAADGASAMSLLSAAETAVVALLDLDMPHVDGLDILRAAAANPATLGRHRFILLTAVSQSRVQQAGDIARAMGVRIILKPFDIDDVLSAAAAAAAQLSTE